MGMAASQVRFLSLQNRKNTIGLNLMTLSNRKTALSRDMNRVANEYNNAMNQKILKWSNDSGVTYNDISYDTLMKPSEINSNLPYIITDAQGRVVIDDKNIVLDGQDTGVSYRQLATMISAYSRSDTNSGYALYENTDNLTGFTGDVIRRDANGEITYIGKADSGKANENEYMVDLRNNYDFKTSMRYDLLIKLGLITEAQKQQFDGAIKELYGSEEVKDLGNYDKVLSDFDWNRAEASATYGVEKSDGTTDNLDYSTVFGSLVVDGGSLRLDGGCALGNLALAKAYQQEYQAFLNTEFTHDILVPTKEKLASSPKATSELDAQNTTSENRFVYHEDVNTGVSNRMLGFLEQTGDVVKNGNDYNFKSSGILDNLQFYNGSGVATNYWNVIHDECDTTGMLFYDLDNKGCFDETLDEDTWGGTWGNLFDMNKRLDYRSSTGSYDIDGDGYYYGSDYIDNKGNNDQTGVSIILRDDLEMTRGSRGWGNVKDKFSNVIDAFARSLKNGVPNINKNAVDYAARMTKRLYEEADTKVKDSDGSSSSKKARRRATRVCDDIFGVGTCDDYGDKDPAAVNMTNAISAFMTFYAMYDAVDGDETRIVAGKEKSFRSEISNMTSYYDSSLASSLKDSSQNVMSKLLTDWQNEGGTVTEETINITANANSTARYKREETDDDGTYIYYADVSGRGNADGTGFASITNIKYSEVINGTEYTTDEYSYSSSASTGTKTLTNVAYNFNYDASGNISGTSKYADVTYNYNSTTGKTSSKIDLTYPEIVNSQFVKTININDDNSIRDIKSGTGADVTNGVQEDKTVYYIATESNGSTKDPNYQYLIKTADVKGSCFASTIKTKPADLYSAQFDKLVTDCEIQVAKLQEQIAPMRDFIENRGMDYFDAMFKLIAENGWVYDKNVNNPDKKEESKNYLNAKLQNNMYFITEVDTLDGTDFNYATKIAVNCSKVFQVYDTDAQNVALSKYEAEKADITSKEKQIDIRMNKLETEQNAIKTELDSIKNIIKDNVDKTFKIFS